MMLCLHSPQAKKFNRGAFTELNDEKFYGELICIPAETGEIFVIVPEHLSVNDQKDAFLFLEEGFAFS